MPFDLLSQPFCWLTFSHWTKNCRRAPSYQRETMDCCIICLTETWMSAMVPESAIELTGFSVHRSDRTKELTGKSRGGGVCFYNNNSWCDERNLHSIKSFCSSDLEFHTLLCRPFWLLREFTAIIVTTVYIPPQANTDQALKELYRNISEQETAHPDAAFVVTGDFNKANFRTIAPKYFKHITINTRGDHVLDHCYSPFQDAYKSLPRPPFGKSDHSSVLLLSAYRQKLKCEAPALRTIQCWSDQSDAILQDCFDHVDWDMFRAASDDDIEAYSDTVTCFIRKCIEDVVPTKTIRIYPNQKPWINSEVRGALSTWTSAFKSGNIDDRKQASYDLRKSIKATKRQYKIYTVYTIYTVNIAASLPEELNHFYARFEADNTAHTESAPHGCCRRGESILHFCCGCNPILQTGEHPQSCGPGWHTRPCALSMRIPDRWGLYRHFQFVCGSLMLQKIHHCAHTKEK